METWNLPGVHYNGVIEDAEHAKGALGADVDYGVRGSVARRWSGQMEKGPPPGRNRGRSRQGRAGRIQRQNSVVHKGLFEWQTDQAAGPLDQLKVAASV